MANIVWRPATSDALLASAGGACIGAAGLLLDFGDADFYRRYDSFSKRAGQMRLDEDIRRDDGAILLVQIGTNTLPVWAP
jgi:hypothetical protein